MRKSLASGRSDLAERLRREGKTWAQIAIELRAEWPGLTPRAALRVARAWTQDEAAQQWNQRWAPPQKTGKDFSLWETWPNGGRRPSFDTLDKLAQLYQCSLAELISDISDHSHLDPHTSERDEATAHVVDDGDQVPALGLLSSAEASDIGPATVEAVEYTVHELAEHYPRQGPTEMLDTLQGWQRKVSQLLDGRVTLAQRRDLMRQAGWLSLLAATADIDVARGRSAAANFTAARTLAGETGDKALTAWTFETQAWQAVSNGNLETGGDLCQAGLDIAQPDSEIWIQLCTQSARVAARRGDAKATRALVDQAIDSIGRRPRPETDHHFAVGEARVLQHCAAALVWLGRPDTAAEDYARQAVEHHEHNGTTHSAAATRLNLAILLARAGQPTEAVHLGNLALDSAWRLCSTDLFLLADLRQALTRYDDAGTAEFNLRYQDAVQSIQREAVQAR